MPLLSNINRRCASGKVGVSLPLTLFGILLKPPFPTKARRDVESVKLVSIETFTKNPLGFVRVRTDDGHEGYGQMAPYHANISALVLHEQIAPTALGREVDSIDDVLTLANLCVEAEHKFPGSYVCRAVGGMDTALWDLLGKRAGLCVRDMIATRGREEVEAYGSSMRRDIGEREEANRLVKLREQHGFQAFKIRVAKSFGHDEDEWPGRTETIVPTVRKAIGDDAFLFVDANSGYSPAKAIQVGRMLEQEGVTHFEEPCPYPELEWTKEVADALDVPVTGGEQDTDMAQWRRMIHMRAVDIVQPDICYVGGLSRALQVARMADDASLLCMPHAANLSMVSVFTLHMLAAIPNAGRFMEFSIEDTPWTRDLFTPALRVEDGRVRVPDAPGWGVTVNPEWLKSAEYRISKN